MIPYPDPVVVALLRDLPPLAELDGRISTVLDAQLPAVRITHVGHREPPTSWEATPLYQIEVWATDQLQAGQLAWAIKNSWPTAVRQAVGDAVVHGRWVDSDPYPLPDPETELPRSLLTVGIRLSGASA